MNLILEKTSQVTFFTNMREVIEALGIKCSDYDWYVSDVETNGYPFEEGWHSGEELESRLEWDDIQFIWAVFSAFPKGVRAEVRQTPYVEGNSFYWDGSEPRPQLEGANFEIACWDSSATILIGLKSKLAKAFKTTFSDAVELRQAVRQ
ncbi:hypothetical protein [Marinobacter salexigens]|uniref:Uncharacterized protein n=1 Tax=Marinobacter salexigens TaxID=1925763 RepID=A0ABS6A3H3_9GAMM|nr:hypothetical protein [Marinobacter salexigens]MBU2872661.1 hypothetical protein [Marinobacter salexigens]